MLLTINSVLNLIINGLPSKRNPTYSQKEAIRIQVLNLIINGLPSKQITNELSASFDFIVLNLIINGLPSKLI